MSPTFDPSLNAKPGDAVWMRWFSNLAGGTPFDATDPVDPSRKPGSTDFSLQLAATLQNFSTWQLQDGEFATGLCRPTGVIRYGSGAGTVRQAPRRADRARPPASVRQAVIALILTIGDHA